jgi:hypothetical protein
MHLFTRIYEFAASAGAFEGYVYHREDLDMKAMVNWVGNLKAAHALLPQEALGEIQPAIDQTLGRAIQSLILRLGEGHSMVDTVRSMTRGRLPASPDDFQKEKAFKKGHQKDEWNMKSEERSN